MRKLILLTGIAAMAAAVPSLADAQGQGRGKGGGHAQAERQGGGQEARGRGRGNRGGEARQGRGDRRAEQPRQAEQPRGRQLRAEARQERRGERREARGSERRGEGDLRRAERRAERPPARAAERRDLRESRRAEQRVRRDFDRQERGSRRELQVQRREPLRYDEGRYAGREAYWREGRAMPVAVYRNGCPPGLARQNAFCLPPGQLRRAQLIGQRLPFATSEYNVPDRYRYRFQDDERYYYRYGQDGHVYELNRGNGLVSSVIPLFGTGLQLGEPMPLGYEVYNVPLQYRSYYPDGSDALYRYDDNAIYRVNGDSGIVESIVALLTGGSSGLGGLGVGQLLPGGYDAYNVPLDYRDRYYDTDEHLYRYADGNIYQVDPQTRLIEAVISLLG